VHVHELQLVPDQTSFIMYTVQCISYPRRMKSLSGVLTCLCAPLFEMRSSAPEPLSLASRLEDDARGAGSLRSLSS
jgi:hypothetical protein